MINMNFDFSYRFNIFKNKLKDRMAMIDRKTLFSGLVTVLMVALIPGTLSLVNRINNLNKQAASCTTRSSIVFTDLSGNGIQNAKTGDLIRANVYVNGSLDAGEIAIRYYKDKYRLLDGGINQFNVGSFSHILQATTDANAGEVIFSIARPLDGSSLIAGRIASIDFEVISTANDDNAPFVYGDKTQMVKGGIASGSNCVSSPILILNPTAEPATGTPVSATGTPSSATGTPVEEPIPTLTSHPLAPCLNFERNCIQRTLADYPTALGCPANSNLDPSGQCGQEFKCCIPIPTATPTGSVAKPTIDPNAGHACLNYERNCVQRTPADYPTVQNCPANSTFDPNGQCGQEFKCCLPQ